MKKNIVHIITSLKMGGAESLMVDFLSHPDAQRYHHRVLFFYDGPNRLRLEEQGITCYHIKGLFHTYDPVFLIRLYALVKSLNPDCIHTWLWSANCIGRIIAKFLKIPVINSFHSEVTQDGTLRNSIDYYSAHCADRIVAVSYGVAQSLLQKNKTTISHKLTIIKNGIDAHKIQETSKQIALQRSALDLSPEHYVIGSVGRWTYCKNYSFLINLFYHIAQNHDHARLLLVGSGEEKDNLQSQVQELGITTKVLFIEGKRALGYYPLMDCFIQTTFKEGISIALLEAMSCSLPCVVVQNSSDHDVLVDEENGILIATHSIDVSSSALQRLMHNASYAHKLARNGYQTMQKDFELTTMIHTYYTEYEHVMPLYNK